MSHYSVCVAIPSARLIGKEITGCMVEEILDDILAPYDEGPDDYKYLTFEDKTDEAHRDYEVEKTAAVKFPDGTIHSPYDSVFTKRFVVRDGHILERVNGDTIETPNSRGLELVAEYPLNKLYSFEEYCAAYCSYSEHKGRWGYWGNPNAKWDWFAIGGRSSGAFLVKSDLQECLEVRDSASHESGFKRVNGVRKGNVEWSENHQRARQGYSARYELLCRCFKTGNITDLGPFAVLTDDGIQGWCETLYIKDESLDAYLERCGVGVEDRYVMGCYAFVDKQGQWHSMGDMGWFGLSANDKDERVWHDEVQKFLAELDDDDFLVMVDCHI